MMFVNVTWLHLWTPCDSRTGSVPTETTSLVRAGGLASAVLQDERGR